MQSPPFPRYLVHPRSIYSPQHLVLKNPQLPFLLYYISEIKRISWGRRNKSHVLRWSSLFPFCLLLYFTLLLWACFTQSGISVFIAIYFPVNIGTKWLEKCMGKHNVSGQFMGFLSLILRKRNVYKMQRNECLENLYRCFQWNLEEMAWPLIFVGLGTFKQSGTFDTWYSYESWNAECHLSWKCWGEGGWYVKAREGTTKPNGEFRCFGLRIDGLNLLNTCHYVFYGSWCPDE